MKIPVEKNKEYIVEIIDNGFQGEGIAKISDYTIFVANAIKGEKVKKGETIISGEIYKDENLIDSEQVFERALLKQVLNIIS